MFKLAVCMHGKYIGGGKYIEQSKLQYKTCMLSIVNRSESR